MSEHPHPPGRRPAVTRTVAHRGETFAITVSFDLRGAPRAVHAAGFREGSDMQADAWADCRIISAALQGGVELRALARWPGQGLGDTVLAAVGEIVSDGEIAP